MNSKRILWINSGGTLVSAPYDDPRRPPDMVAPLPAEESAKLVLALLASIDGAHERVDGYSYAIQPFQKDSKQFTRQDIAALADIVATDEHEYVLMTHGTDKMAENAEALARELERLGVHGKTVLFVGSMMPLSMQARFPALGDAEANMRYAISRMDDLPNGVYVAARDSASRRMICAKPEAVQKDMHTSRNDLQFTVKNRQVL